MKEIIFYFRAKIPKVSLQLKLKGHPSSFQMWTTLFIYACLAAVGGTDPPIKLLLNEIGMDNGDVMKGESSSFIEVKRSGGRSGEQQNLNHHYIAVLNTNRIKACNVDGEIKGIHLELRGLLSLSNTAMSGNQLIGWIGDPKLHGTNHLATFHNFKYPLRINENSLLNVKTDGYLLIMSIYAENPYWNEDELRPLSGGMKQWLLDGFYDLAIIRGPRASIKSIRLNQIISHKVPTSSIRYLEDITRTKDTSQSNCGERHPFQIKWDLTSPTVGQENSCPGGTLDMEMELEGISDSMPLESMEEEEDDCSSLTEASFVNQDKLDQKLAKAKERGSGSCGYMDGELAEIKAGVSVSKKRKVLRETGGETSGETEEDEDTPWCKKSEFKEEWIQQIQQYQSHLLPVAGKVKQLQNEILL